MSHARIERDVVALIKRLSAEVRGAGRTLTAEADGASRSDDGATALRALWRR